MTKNLMWVIQIVDVIFVGPGANMSFVEHSACYNNAFLISYTLTFQIEI